MSTPDINRQIVQDGLDARAAQRAEAAEDAIQDAAEKNLLATINRKAEARRNALATVEAIQKSHDADQKRIAARKARRDENWEIFQTRTFGSLIIPLVMAILYVFDMMPFWIAVAAWIASGLFIIANFVAYTFRNRTTREALARVWKRFMAVFMAWKQFVTMKKTKETNSVASK